MRNFHCVAKSGGGAAAKRLGYQLQLQQPGYLFLLSDPASRSEISFRSLFLPWPHVELLRADLPQLGGIQTPPLSPSVGPYGQ